MTDEADAPDAVSRMQARAAGAEVIAPERMQTLLELLGRPDSAAPVIHVAGTHGRGSIARAVGCLLAGLGLSAGTLATTHLQELRERIRVAAAPISEEDLSARLDELEPYLSEVDVRHAEPVGFGEALAAVAFAHFADAPVDVVVLEGGPDLREEPVGLASAAVGILTGPATPGSGAPAITPAQARALVERVEPEGAVVAAGLAEEVAGVLEDAAGKRQVRVVHVEASTGVADRRIAVGGQHLDLVGATVPFDDVYLPVHGAHQARNAVCALTAVEAFLGFAGGLDPEIVRESFAALRLQGRLEVVRRRDAPSVILDAADDPASAMTLAASLREEFTVRHRLLVIGLEQAAPGLADLREPTLRALVDTAHHVVVTAPGSADAVPAHELLDAVAVTGATVESAEDVAAALDLATGLASEEDVVVVGGSPATVGDARTALGLGIGDDGEPAAR